LPSLCLHYVELNKRIISKTAAMADRHMRRSVYWKAGETELICLHGGLRLAQGGYLGHGSNLVQTTSAIDMMRTMDKDAYAEYQKMGKNDDGGLSSWNLSSSESGEKLQTFKIFFLNLQKFQ